MYFFAVLMAISFIYNMNRGSWPDAIFALALAIALVGCKYFWDEDDGESLFQRLRMPILVVMVVGFGAAISILVLNTAEISAEKYVRLAEIKSSAPSVAKLIQESIEDGEISVMEYSEINTEYQDISKSNAKKFLSGKMVK